MTAQVSFNDSASQRLFTSYKEGRATAADVKAHVEGRLNRLGYKTQRMVTEAPAGYYYRAEDVARYNEQVRQYNRELSAYKAAVIRDVITWGNSSAQAPTIPNEPDRVQAAREAADTGTPYVKPQGVTAKPLQPITPLYSPTMPSEELSVVTYDVPVDTRKPSAYRDIIMRGQGPAPDQGAQEQLTRVLQVPSVLLGQSAFALRELSLRAEKVPGLDVAIGTASYSAWGIVGAAAKWTNPENLVRLPVDIALTIPRAADYLKDKAWGDVQVNLSRTVGDYVVERAQNPKLLYSDVGYQLGSYYTFKGLAAGASSIARSTSRALAALPADTIGTKGLAAISGESTVPFKAAWELAAQKGEGIVSDAIGGKGLATISGAPSTPIKQILQVARQQGSDLAWEPNKGQIAKFSGYTGGSLPFKQTWEAILSDADRLIGEPVGTAGLATIGGAEPMPFKQWLEISKQKGLGFGTDAADKALARISGAEPTSFKAAIKFLQMKGVEDYTFDLKRMAAYRATPPPYIPRTTGVDRDISGLLKIKADEAAQQNAAKMEAFMKDTFREPTVNIRGAPDTPLTSLVQMGKQGRGAWGTRGVDVFPYEVLSYPSKATEKPITLGSVKIRDIPALDAGVGNITRLAQREAARVTQAARSDLKLMDFTIPKLKTVDLLKLQDLPIQSLDDTQRQRTGPILNLDNILAQAEDQAERQLNIAIPGLTGYPRTRPKRKDETLLFGGKKKGKKRKREAWELRADKAFKFTFKEPKIKSFDQPVISKKMRKLMEGL